MKNVLFLTSAFILVCSLQAVNLEIDFNDANGTNLNLTGTDYGSWDFGGAQTNTRGTNSGHLNVGYTHYYKGLFKNNQSVSQLDAGNVFRRFTLNDIVGEGGDFSFTVVYDSWQLNDPKTQNQGLGFALENGNGNGVTVALKAGSGNFSSVYSQGSGSIAGAYTGNSTGIGLSNNFNLTNNNDNKDLTLQIIGNLVTGNWQARFSLESNFDNNDVDSLSWTNLGSGTGMNSISGLQMKTVNGGAAWGSDETGNVTGNWVTVDNISLNVAPVPEPSTYALFVGLVAFLFIAIRKRKV